MKQLLDRIADRSAVVGVVGQGYVGLPLALVFCEAGFRVVGLDVDRAKVEALNAGRSYIKHIGAERVAQAVAGGCFRASADFEALRECDAAIICVPTPLGRHREPDNGYIHATAREIAPRLHRGMLVVLESTTYPGTTDEEVRPILEKSGLRCPEDFLLAFSPEREDPGNARFSTRTIPKVVGGVDAPSTDAAVALYSSAVERVVRVSSARVAESAKLLENIYRSVNIALVNELKQLCHRMDLDVHEVVDAAATKPFGFMAFHPGPGLGGHCIPIDPFYLTWKAREYEFATRFIELAGEINTSMPYYVVQRTLEAMNDRGRALKGANVLVVGLAYKKNVDDVRESPSFRVIELLQEHGANVAYHDPYVPKTHRMRHHDLRLESRDLDDAGLRGTDAAIILTDHDGVDWARLVRLVPLVVDTRNATKNVKEGREKIVAA